MAPMKINIITSRTTESVELLDPPDGGAAEEMVVVVVVVTVRSFGKRTGIFMGPPMLMTSLAPPTKPVYSTPRVRVGSSSMVPARVEMGTVK